jgi:PPP family 3-phenylpropionic acid transporter
MAGMLLSFGLLYATLYGAYGAQSPFLSPFLAERGATPGEIGAILAVAALVRIGAGPAVGHLADRLQARRAALVLGAASTGLISLGYLAAHGPWPLLLVVASQALVVAAVAPIADAVGLAAARRAGFPYGWLRGTGSAAFVAMTLGTGQLVATFGLWSAMALGGGLFLAMAAAALALPRTEPEATAKVVAEDARHLLVDPRFLRLVVVAALVTGSHAVNETFAVIRWGAAGLSPQMSAVLWSAAVASEVIVFLLIGPPLLARLGPARAIMLAALGGMARWSAMATTTAVPLLLAAQAMHGLTFALLHLAAMKLISEIVPDDVAATAQTLYGTFGLGIANAALTLAAGFLYGSLGAGAYWVMVALCATALPLAAGLRSSRAG